MIAIIYDQKTHYVDVLFNFTAESFTVRVAIKMDETDKIRELICSARSFSEAMRIL